MSQKKVFPQSQVPVRKSVELLPQIFRTSANDKFMSAVVDPLIQPGVLEKTSGFVGRRYGKTYNGIDTYLDSNETLRSRYQLEPGVVVKKDRNISKFYDYLDFKNQLKFFGVNEEQDNKITNQTHYSWDPPIDWDKFVNYRDYYWEPAGPPPVPVLGQSTSVISFYSVSLGFGSSFVFSPDGLTNNPTITLYRGQTYKFKINAPDEGFAIRTNYDTGSLLFNPNFPYSKGQLVVFDGQIWKAKEDLLADPTRIITTSSDEWELVSLVSETNALDFNNGVTNNGIEVGTLEFTVPFDAPDVLFYQGRIDPNRVGRFIISNIESNTSIDIKHEIIGKQNYTSSNGIVFTNGLVVEFRGRVSPSEYSSDRWLVDGVGQAITLTKFNDLVVPNLSSQDVFEVLFDNAGFDEEPFDDALSFPNLKDYITIAKDSRDLNPWSRYNRWFHKSVLEYAYNLRGQTFSELETARAKRPIIEFKSNIQLFEHGSIAKQTVDFLDNFTDDIFSKIEGSRSYNIDGKFLFDGARILFTSDTDILANNKIYQAKFIIHNNVRQLTLVQTSDSESLPGECVLVRRGKVNGGKMFFYNGSTWNLSQEKTSVNQPPLFDVFDDNGVSFSDEETYPVSSFKGSKILSYKIANSVIDKELGFGISYLNINNVGDIQFEWSWELENFQYTIGREIFSVDVSTGFYQNTQLQQFFNGWTLTDNKFIQPIIDSIKIEDETNEVVLTTINWDKNPNAVIKFYINGNLLKSNYTRDKNTFTFDTFFKVSDILSVRIIANDEPVSGYYEIPTGLEKNPLNNDLKTFTLGQAIDHLTSALEYNEELKIDPNSSSNLRDISDYQQFAKRFMMHSGVAPLSISLICDKDFNIIKSLQYAKQSYTEFKNKFLEVAAEVDFDDNFPNFVDTVIDKITQSKNTSSPFVDSDMIGSGAFTAINYVVEDEGIVTFALNEKFTLSLPSKKAVYVYKNQKQLIHKKDYTFNETFGFVNILTELNKGDQLEIREYVSTSFNFIPPTPTSIGLYKKYTPSKFIDDTYREPQEVIQGHDGSITIAFGDFRDDLLLELEYRIYNNIKIEYDPNILNIDDIFGGYYGNALYTKSQLDNIVNQEFLKWIQNTNINYAVNDYFIENETFTYTYSNMIDPTRTQNLPGWWRGVYKWFYDTDRPHRCPWEMLGFSEQPDWWENEYGAAPYTKDNLILWEDLKNGVIKQGLRAGIYDRYKRPSILDHIPVDSNGKLLSPLDSGLAENFILINNKGEFVLGDIAPVEYAWRSSSEWPFAVMTALALLKPFDFTVDNFNRVETKVNKIGQKVNVSTNKFYKLTDSKVPGVNSEQCVGLVQYLTDYLRSKGKDEDLLLESIENIDVKLSTRLSGFVDKKQQRYLLDSKNPASASSSIFVPPENYDIIFNVSTPIFSLTYSGVIIEKTENGWIINGYDSISPYFEYFEPGVSVQDPVITVGGVSESFLEWEPEKTFNNGAIAKFKNEFFRSIRTHESAQEFDPSFWRKIPKVPLVGGVSAQKRKNFNKTKLKKLIYGSLLSSVQAVVDFLLGYEEYLKTVGFKFNNYDSENKVSQDWTTSAKEFMFWTKHNWEIGSIITLSPAAQKLSIDLTIGVIDNLLDGFYDYQVLKADGKPLLPEFIDVSRDFRNFTISTTNTVDGVYYLKLYGVVKEHVAVFDDRTVFNDVIYDKTSGYRQERIKSLGFRTTDWDGNYTSPGFLFDNVNIDVWQPFKDYRLGDIVSYKSFIWVSQFNQSGSSTFDDENWSKIDSTVEKRLVANFDYKINQIEDFYNVNFEGVGETQRDLARHAIGYQTRDYLKDLAEDSITQFQLYQGFIREKGTVSSITKVFNKLSRTADADSIELNEEWAFKVGRFGGVDQTREVEFELERLNFKINPQPVIIVSSDITQTDLDQYYRISKSNFTFKLDTPNINPVSYNESLKTAGYVRDDQVNFIVKSTDDILNIDINEVIENDHVWVTFDSVSWNVLRYNQILNLVILDIIKIDNVVSITFNKRHSFNINDIIGIKNVENLSGFYRVLGVTARVIQIEVNSEDSDPVLGLPSSMFVSQFTKARFKSFDEIAPEEFAVLKQGSKLWIDKNQNQFWQVVEKTNQYFSKKTNNFRISNPQLAGYKVLYNPRFNQTIVSIPIPGFVTTYVEGSSGLELSQILPRPNGFENEIFGSFGQSMALSQDSRWLVVGSPKASGIRSNFLGNYEDVISNPAFPVLTGDTVLYNGRLWVAVKDRIPGVTVSLGDGSSIDFESQDWAPASINLANQTGRNFGLTEQGMITVYENVRQQWILRHSFISPRPEEKEFFGSDIQISFKNDEYYMAVSAPGSLNNKGRVYLYVFRDSEWQHDKHLKYTGIYDPSKTYNSDEVVWYDSNLWKAEKLISGDGSTITINNNGLLWKKLDPIATQNSLPQSISINDNSYLAVGLLTDDQLGELVKEGDQFGSSISFSQNGDILAVGAPNSDRQYFQNYRGVWNSKQKYKRNDVVHFEGEYFRLIDSNNEIEVSSVNEIPRDSGSRWHVVGDSTLQPVGKVFVYEKSNTGLYLLKQTLAADTLNEINDTGTDKFISTGDQFGFSVKVSNSGNTLVVTSPRSDINFQDQGAAFVFKTDDNNSVKYRLKQKLESFEKIPNEYFGQSVSISPNELIIAIGARNFPFNLRSLFDNSQTVFDEERTRFSDFKGYAGAVYVFEKKSNNYLLSEKLENQSSPFDAFGFSLDCHNSTIAVGSPYYAASTTQNGQLVFDSLQEGQAQLYRKLPDISSWKTLAIEEPKVNIDKIQSIHLYDNIRNVKIQDIDIVDHTKLKILNLAEQEIKFKTNYDPAVYSNGNDELKQSIDIELAWAEKHVGELWWDLSTAKWFYAEQGDISYRVSKWNNLVEGASIDIYEWVESRLRPSEWAAIADTNEGLALDISGQPLYPNDDVFSVKNLLNPLTGEVTNSNFYYWVKNKVVVPKNKLGRRISANEVRRLIENPTEFNLPYISMIGKNKFILYNFKPAIISETALLNILYKEVDRDITPSHNEYVLLAENSGASVIPVQLENKWIDSLVGVNLEGKRVPDSDLSERQRYGLKVRPRQSMFVNRLPILRTLVKNINSVLRKEAFADLINFKNLESRDFPPAKVLNLYDTSVDTVLDLQNVGVARVRQAVLKANIIDGKIDTIDIVDSGFGYRSPPPVEIEGDGIGAAAKAFINRDGIVVSVSILNKGRKYSSAVIKIRSFSVLVRSDNTVDNFWSIYGWDNIRKVFFRTQTQSFDTTRYWKLVDWWKDGYSTDSKIVKEITTIIEEPTIRVEIGDLIRIKEFAQGGWAVFEKNNNIENNFLQNYRLIAREKGTIELSSALYDKKISGIGYDFVKSFDIDKYDEGIAKELRNILLAVKQDIFVGEYRIEWNNLFFASVQYAFVEQQYIDWAFKTSFLDATHNVGPLIQKKNYKNDSLESFQQYVNEVKPFRTTVREYISKYNNIENYNSSAIDFDIPSYYSNSKGKIVSAINEDFPNNIYPWKWWQDNQGFGILSIEVADQGEDYQQPPQVLIEGNGTDASARAFISNGKVSGIVLNSSGKGFTKRPNVTLVGGNIPGSREAKAVAILGNSLFRAMKVVIKFDQISKSGVFNFFDQTDRFVATGFSSTFDLSYPATTDKNKISLIKNGQLVLDSEYRINTFVIQNVNSSEIKGRLIFNILPEAGDLIEISYEKDVKIFDSVNRIEKFYSPIVGMKGRDLNQLMTGIDFGGVQVQGTMFEVTGGWDAVPWFTDSWDSVEASPDYFVVADGSTTDVELPFVPKVGEEINIYLKRANEDRAVRIDKPSFTLSDDSSSSVSQPGIMPTFVGNGIDKVVEIGTYVNTEVGDTLIFRKVNSDGAVVIRDPNLLDTELSGGSLFHNNGAYSTALGTFSEDIVIDGSKFISPEQVPAPEENIPGQVLDSVSVKVFSSLPDSVAPLQSSVVIADGIQKIFDIGLTILETPSVSVIVDKVKRSLGSGTLDYSINFINNTIEFTTPPLTNQIVEILSIGIGGIQILDFIEFVADGETKLFLTNARFADTQSIFVTVNGEYQDIEFINSTGVVDSPNRTLVNFIKAPLRRSVIKVVSLGSATNENIAAPVVRVNKQVIVYDGSTLSYDLDNFVNAENSSAISAMIVEVNNQALRGPDSIYKIYDGITRSFELGLDPLEASGSILTSNIKVFINNKLKEFIVDYFYEGISKILTIEEKVLNKGDQILIVVDLRSEFLVENNKISFVNDVILNEGDTITVTWYSQYRSMRIISDEYTGGKVQYQINATPISISHVAVYKNGARLTSDKDYKVSLFRRVVYIIEETTPNDLIKIVVYGENVTKLPSAYEIHKDMFNIYHYKRYAAGKVTLTNDLYYYEQTITVSDAINLSEPIKSRNIPGTIYINGERIDYLIKDGNTLSQLRRGVLGTPIADLHLSGSIVVDVGYSETLPYNENEDTINITSDGTSILIGPLNYIPRKSNKNVWYTDTIPDNFGPCDELEVFVSGRRLRKDPILVWNESLGPSSPSANIQLEAEFSVDGESPFIRLTEAVLAGLRITIIKRTGKIWYDAGELSASSGQTLLNNKSSIAKFISQKSSILPK